MENVLDATCTYSSCASYTKKPGYTAKNTGSQHKNNTTKERRTICLSVHSRTCAILSGILFPGKAFSPAFVFPAATFACARSNSRHKSRTSAVKTTVSTRMEAHSRQSLTSTFSTLSSRAPNKSAAANKKEKAPAIRKLLFSSFLSSVPISLIHTLPDHILGRIIHGNIDPANILADQSQH